MIKSLGGGSGTIIICLAMALLAACSSSSVNRGDTSTGKPRPAQDGAPSYFQDVSQIPDAVPTPHNGPYKAAPYTVLGRSYKPMQDGRTYRESGLASWYGTKFHGQLTANGENYDLYGMTAAHKTLPLPSYVRVTNQDNQRSIIVRVNDRGPFHSDRIIDLSYAGAVKLGFAERGTARVKVEGIDPVVWQQQNNPRSPGQPQPVSPAAQTAALHGGLYLQLGAFASDQAAEQLRRQVQGLVQAPVFVSPVSVDARTLHRVRLGPVDSHDEAQQLMKKMRVANLGSPALVSAD